MKAIHNTIDDFISVALVVFDQVKEQNESNSQHTGTFLDEYGSCVRPS